MSSRLLTEELGCPLKYLLTEGLDFVTNPDSPLAKLIAEMEKYTPNVNCWEPDVWENGIWSEDGTDVFYEKVIKELQKH